MAASVPHACLDVVDYEPAELVLLGRLIPAPGEGLLCSTSFSRSLHIGLFGAPAIANDPPLAPRRMLAGAEILEFALSFARCEASVAAAGSSNEPVAVVGEGTLLLLVACGER